MKPLKGNKNVEVLFSSGKRVSSSFLHCVYLLNKEDSRFVVSVPKKNFSLAVDRNKIKRFLREALRKHSKEVLSFGGGWFMFIYSSDKVVSFLDIDIHIIFSAPVSGDRSILLRIKYIIFPHFINFIWYTW